MNGHRHKWKVMASESISGEETPKVRAYCKGHKGKICTHLMDTDEIELRLNICEIFLDENILEECARVMEDIEWEQMEKKLRELDAKLRGIS